MDKILLINPHETEQLGYTNPPLGLLYIAGMLLKHGYNVRVVDGCIEGKKAVGKAIEEFHPDWVGISCLTPGRKKAVEIAKLAKDFNPNIKVVMGGAHPTIMYRQMLENNSCIDYIVLGEGEETFLELVQEKEPPQINGLVYRDEQGLIVKTPPRNYANLDDLPFPAWHLIDIKKYPPRSDGRIKNINGVDIERETRISVVFSRGCRGHCDFCSTWWIWQGWRHRSAKNMVDELELLYNKYGIRSFSFADDAMTVDRKATIELCDEIVKRKLKIAFTVTTRTDCVDEVVLQKLKNAGCYIVNYGIETGSQILLEKMGKENDILNAEKAIKMTKQAGISVNALIIVGNVGETDETVNQTVNFLMRTRPDSISSVGGLWVLPGTKLYQHCRRQGFIDDDFWLSDEPFKIYTLEHSLEKLDEFHSKIAKCNRQTKLRRIIEILRYKPQSLPRRIMNKYKNILG